LHNQPEIPHRSGKENPLQTGSNSLTLLSLPRRHSRRHTREKPSFELEMNASCSPLISCQHNHHHAPLPSLSLIASTCPILLVSPYGIARAVASARSRAVDGGRDKKWRPIWPGLASVGGGVSHWCRRTKKTERGGQTGWKLKEGSGRGTGSGRHWWSGG
jgi:hypothetical protein